MGKLRGIPLSCLGPKALQQLRDQGIDPNQVGKGPRQFAVPSTLPAPPTKEKYHRSVAAERTHDGEVFDSKLELAAYRWLVDHGIPFERQVEVELQPGFLYQGRKVRKISYYSDFKFSLRKLEKFPQKPEETFPKNLAEKSGQKPEEKSEEKLKEKSEDFLWVDMKGFETAEFKLKWKMLLYRGVHVHCVKSVPALVQLLQGHGLALNPAKIQQTG